MSSYVDRGWEQIQVGNLLWRCGQCGAAVPDPEKGSHEGFHIWVRAQFTELRQHREGRRS